MKVLVIDDNIDLLELINKKFQSEKADVQVFSNPVLALEKAREYDFDVAIIDIRIPEMNGMEVFKKLKKFQPSIEVIMLTAYISVNDAIEAMKLGAYDYLSKPYKMSELVKVVKKAYEKKMLSTENRYFNRQFQIERRSINIVGHNEIIQNIIKLIRKIAPTDSPVMIQGESGTGKELVARMIHEISPRCTYPFVVVDCSALQETLLESELFGHEKGAFTDAHIEKKGLLEIADKGTVFLDEIGEMSKNLQAKLLRAIETTEFRHLGGTKSIQVDVRFIAATNRDLKDEVSKKNFREDLYYRLNVISIHIPPLRRRKDDIEPLVKHFLETLKVSNSKVKSLSADFLKKLTDYDWPGNIRELSNVIKRAMILSEDREITSDHIILNTVDLNSKDNFCVNLEEKKDVDSGIDKKDDDFGALNPVTEEHNMNLTIKTLEKNKWNRSKAADELGISRQALYKRIKKYKLDLDGTEK